MTEETHGGVQYNDSIHVTYSSWVRVCGVDSCTHAWVEYNGSGLGSAG